MLPDVIGHLFYPLRLHIQSLADFAKNYYPIIALQSNCVTVTITPRNACKQTVVSAEISRAYGGVMVTVTDLRICAKSA